MKPVYTVYQNEDGSIAILRRDEPYRKTFLKGTEPWRILYFTQFRKNVESPTRFSEGIGWDTQQDIAHLVYTNYK